MNEVISTRQELFENWWFSAEIVFDRWQRAQFGDAMPFRFPEEKKQQIQDAFELQHQTASLRDESTRLRLRTDFLSIAHAALMREFQAAAVRPRPKKPPKMNKLKPRGRRLSNSAHARNLERAWFVAERIIPFMQLREGNLWPGRNGPRSGVPWAALLDEMKRTHPHLCYYISKGKALGDVYRRGVGATAKEKGEPKWFPTHVGGELLDQFNREFREAWDECERALTCLRESFNSGPDLETWAEKWLASPEFQVYEEAQRERLKLPDNENEWERLLHSPITSEDERAGRDAECGNEHRASVTRKDLVEERVRRLVWGMGPAEEKLLWQSPLRDWFLPETRDEKRRSHQPPSESITQYATPEIAQKWRRRQADMERKRAGFQNIVSIVAAQREASMGCGEDAGHSALQPPAGDRGEPRPSPESAPRPQVQARTRKAGRASRTSRRPR